MPRASKIGTSLAGGPKNTVLDRRKMQSVTLTSVVRTAVLLRGDACHLLEQAVEVRIIVERQRRGDVFHRHVAGDEHQLRLFNLLLVDVLQGTDARLVLEEAAEVVLRQAGVVGQCVEVDHLVQMVVDVGDGRAHPFVLALYFRARLTKCDNSW